MQRLGMWPLVSTTTPTTATTRRRQGPSAAFDEGRELPSAVFDEGQELLGRVDALFKGLSEPVGGRSPYDSRDPQFLIEQVVQTTTQLTDLAEAPTRDLVRGLMTVATGPIPDILSAVQHLDVVVTLEQRAQRLAKHAPRFVREHILKIVTLRLDPTAVDQMADTVADWYAETVNIENLLNHVADSDGAIARARATISAAPSIEQTDADALLGDLQILRVNYQRHMDWLGNSAKWLRPGAKRLLRHPRGHFLRRHGLRRL
jgi:hypothetical protein